MQRPMLAPSILSADFARLAEQIDAVAPLADWIHVDVMDGQFVPNLTIGPVVVSSIKKCTQIPLDCHLMIVEPSRYYEAFAKAGADSITFHLEAVADPHEEVRLLKGLGVRAGMAINPETPYSKAEPYLDELDLLLVMSVHPGFAGQSFIPEVLDKVEAAREAVNERRLKADIEIDGGIDVATAAPAAKSGATLLVAGSAIFSASDPAGAASAIRESAIQAVGVGSR